MTRRTSENERTRGTSSRCARACTPEPTIASTDASSRAAARTTSAEAAAVRIAVMCSPSITARQTPVVASNRQIVAWCISRPTDAFPGKTPTSLTTIGPDAHASGHGQHCSTISGHRRARRGVDGAGGKCLETGGNGVEQRVGIERGGDLCRGSG